jgi:hypothetical protein
VDHQCAEQNQCGDDPQRMEEDGVLLLLLPQEPLRLNEMKVELIIVILFFTKH